MACCKEAHGELRLMEAIRSCVAVRGAVLPQEGQRTLHMGAPVVGSVPTKLFMWTRDCIEAVRRHCLQTRQPHRLKGRTSLFTVDRPQQGAVINVSFVSGCCCRPSFPAAPSARQSITHKTQQCRRKHSQTPPPQRPYPCTHKCCMRALTGAGCMH